MRSKRFSIVTLPVNQTVMHEGSFVFARLTSYLDRNKFNYLVRKYQGDSYIKHFTCWNQLKVLMFGQLSRRESLRDLIVAVEAHSGKAKFLGFGDSVTRSNLAKANQNCYFRIVSSALDGINCAAACSGDSPLPA